MNQIKFRVRDKVLKIWCTELEKEKIRQLAEENKMNMNNYLLKMALEGYVLNEDFTEIKQLFYEINRIGNNINQIAYHINRDEDIYKEDIEEVKRQIDLLWVLLRSEFNHRKN